MDQIQTVVVIYAENHSFDNMYGMFPGANGIANAPASATQQRDHDGSVMPNLPPVFKADKPDPDYPAVLPNGPFRIDAAPSTSASTSSRRDPSIFTTRASSRSMAAGTTSSPRSPTSAAG